MESKEESLVVENKDPLIRVLNKSVVIAVKVLAVMMVVVVWLSLVDVIFHMVREISKPPLGFFSVDTLINTLGNFLVVLIAIEVFLNIIFKA